MLVRPMVPMVTIELRDLEETTTEEEIRKAFIAALVEATPDQVEVKALRAGPRGTKAALLVAPRALATVKVLKPSKVVVGWVNATARENKLVIDVLSAWNSDTLPQSVPRISWRSYVIDVESQDTWLQGAVSHISVLLAKLLENPTATELGMLHAPLFR